jgi:hypothetical protein
VFFDGRRKFVCRAYRASFVSGRTNGTGRTSAKIEHDVRELFTLRAGATERRSRYKQLISQSHISYPYIEGRCRYAEPGIIVYCL